MQRLNLIYNLRMKRKKKCCSKNGTEGAFVRRIQACNINLLTRIILPHPSDIQKDDNFVKIFSPD